MSSISRELKRRVCVLTMRSPNGKNTLTRKFFDELGKQIREANQDQGVGSILITGYDHIFSAGADLKEVFLPRIRGELPLVENDNFTGGMDLLNYDWLELLAQSKPIITAINGYAVGGGITAFLNSDILICNQSASFHFPFVKLGIVPEMGATKTLSDRVGLARAKHIILTSETLDAEQAVRDRLVDKYFPDDQLFDQAFSIAADIAQAPEHSLKASKSLLDDNLHNIDNDQLWRRESEILRQCFQHPDHHEAINAWLEKRQPHFSSAKARIPPSTASDNSNQAETSS